MLIRLCINLSAEQISLVRLRVAEMQAPYFHDK